MVRPARRTTSAAAACASPLVRAGLAYPNSERPANVGKLLPARKAGSASSTDQRGDFRRGTLRIVNKEGESRGASSGNNYVITLEDCIGMCGLTEDEVLAIAEHEHLPEIAATALAHYLLSREHGSEEIRDMIVDDIREAQWSDNKEHVLTLLHVLHHFLITHPEARPPEHPWSRRY